MKNNKIKLIKRVKVGQDENLNPLFEEIETIVFAEKRSIFSNEFYKASTQNLRLEAVFVVYPFEYQNEEIIEHENKRYKIIRIFEKNVNELEITVGEKIGV